MLYFDSAFECEVTAPEQMDRLWEQGWRHFGTYFFRYPVAVHDDGIFRVMPLRLDLQRFVLSRSQKRVLAKNRDDRVLIRDASITAEKEALFYHHRRRFREHIPDSLHDFFSAEPATVPCRNREIGVYLDGRLIAVSFLDIGKRSTSAVYAMFELAESRRSLGIFTMLEAIRYSQELGCRYYYPGYAYHEPSFYDYKKNFTGLEALDWRRGWMPLRRLPPGLRASAPDR